MAIDTLAAAGNRAISFLSQYYRRYGRKLGNYAIRLSETLTNAEFHKENNDMNGNIEKFTTCAFWNVFG